MSTARRDAEDSGAAAHAEATGDLSLFANIAERRALGPIGTKFLRAHKIHRGRVRDPEAERKADFINHVRATMPADFRRRRRKRERESFIDRVGDEWGYDSKTAHNLVDGKYSRILKRANERRRAVKFIVPPNQTAVPTAAETE